MGIKTFEIICHINQETKVIENLFTEKKKELWLLVDLISPGRCGGV